MATIKSAELNRIGDGPVATVFSGHHAGVPVALKVYPKRFDKRTLSAYQKEQARLTALRRVTSILTVDGIDELDTGEPALRMELCGQSLFGLVDRYGPVAPADAVVLGRAIAAALAAAHERGVVHGGISPHNVLFRTSGEPVLADFGVTLRQAFARDPLHAIEFLPPETLRTGELTEGSDLYGLGAILHYALTGRSPHPGRLGEQPGERVLRILGEPVPAINNQEVPIGLSTLVARLLAADSSRRPTSTTAVAAQLGDMLPNPPQRQAAADFDDFDGPMPAAPPPVRQAPQQARSYVNDDDFDDFSGPPVQPAAQHAPPPARPQSQYQRPHNPRANAPQPGRPGPGAPPAQGVRQVAPPPQPYRPSMPPAAQFPPQGHQPPPARPPVQVAPPAEAQLAPQLRAPVAPTTKAAPPAQQVAPPPQRAPVVPAVQPVQQTPPVESQVAQQLRAPVAPTAPAAPPVVKAPPVEAQPQLQAPVVPTANAAPPVQVETRVPPQQRAPVVPTGPPVQQAPPVVPVAPVAPPAQQIPPVESQVALQPRPPMAPVLEAPTTQAIAPVEERHSFGLDDAPRNTGEFADFAPEQRAPERTTAMFFPPPVEERKRRIRYDLLAGAGLVLALLALLPLLFLRNDPEELRTTPQIPEVGGQQPGDIEIILNEPVDLTDKVELSWRANKTELDFMVVIAAEGEEDVETKFAERNMTMTVKVRPGIQYCFLIQAVEASHEDDVYESDPRGLRGATCTQ